MPVEVDAEKEEKCFGKLISIRWPKGYRCPLCGNSSYWTKAVRKLLICKNCRKEISPLADTMFSRSRISLSAWFEIIKTLTNSPERVVTATAIFEEVDLGSYRTAWEALRKLRFTISHNEPRLKLCGNVEFDELVISGQVGDYSKISILGALEVDGKKRLSLKMIKNPDEMNIKDYFQRRFSRKTNIIIDSEKLYIRNWLALNRMKPISSKQMYGSKFMNLHIILQDLKFGLRNGHHGISDKYLQENLDEYVFIFNHNNDRGKAFDLLLEYMMKTEISVYRDSKKQNKSFLSIITGSN
jgi:hypothetical protein